MPERQTETEEKRGGVCSERHCIHYYHHCCWETRGVYCSGGPRWYPLVLLVKLVLQYGKA